MVIRRHCSKQCGQVVAQVIKPILCRRQRLVGKVDLRPVVRGQQQVAIGQGVKAPFFEGTDQDDVSD